MIKRKDEKGRIRETPSLSLMSASLNKNWNACRIANWSSLMFVDAQYRRSAQGKNGWRNCNLRTTFEKIVRRAGLKPWPKLFHALRSSRETELARDFPIHVVTAWLGNTPAIAMRHYLLTTDTDFERASGRVNLPASFPGAVTRQIPVQQDAESTGNALSERGRARAITKENGTLPLIATCRDSCVL